MDEMVVAVVGAAAGVTLLGRGLRPVGKMMMRGVVVAGETATASKRGIQGLYDEVKAEREQGRAAGAPVTSAAPEAPATRSHAETETPATPSASAGEAPVPAAGAASTPAE